MVKILLAGLWACIISLGAAYGAVVWKSDAADATSEEFFGGLDYVKTTPISVPMLAGGEVQGYIIAQFVFTVDGKTLRRLSVPPDVFLIDEAYRALYAKGTEIDFDNLDKFDVDALTRGIAAKVNERFKSDLVKDVLVEQFNYLNKDEVRAKTLNVVKSE